MKYRAEIMSKLGNVYDIALPDMADEVQAHYFVLKNSNEGIFIDAETKELFDLNFWPDYHHIRIYSPSGPTHSGYMAAPMNHPPQPWSQPELRCSYLGQDIAIWFLHHYDNERNYYLPMYLNEMPAYTALGPENLFKAASEALEANGIDDAIIIIPPAQLPDMAEATDYITDFIRVNAAVTNKEPKNAKAWTSWRLEATEEEPLE